MPRVLCTLPNASEEISGVKFTPVEGGMLSEEISDGQAEAFLSINGYELHVANKKVDEAAEKAALLARAEAVGLEVKPNWSLAQLKLRVEDAETPKKGTT